MGIEIQVALIGAAATILSAMIATAGVAAIVANRRQVIKLAKEVEAYHAQEGRLVAMLIRRDGEEPTNSLVQSRRGRYRQEVPVTDRPSMTALSAKRIRRRYLSTD
mgnify:CR=1 FL=1